MGGRARESPLRAGGSWFVVEHGAVRRAPFSKARPCSFCVKRMAPVFHGAARGLPENTPAALRLNAPGVESASSPLARAQALDAAMGAARLKSRVSHGKGGE